MSISIGNNSIFNTSTSNLDTSNKTNKVESKLGSDLKKATDDELMEVCKSFESYFIEQAFKEMKKTVPTSSEENEYMSYFGDMLTEKYSENVAEKGNLGIAQMLYESMKRN